MFGNYSSASNSDTFLLCHQWRHGNYILNDEFQSITFTLKKHLQNLPIALGKYSKWTEIYNLSIICNIQLEFEDAPFKLIVSMNSFTTCETCPMIHLELIRFTKRFIEHACREKFKSSKYLASKLHLKTCSCKKSIMFVFPIWSNIRQPIA